MNIETIISNFFHDKSNIYVKDLLFNLKQNNNKNSKMNESNMINYVINSSEFNEYFSKTYSYFLGTFINVVYSIKNYL